MTSSSPLRRFLGSLRDRLTLRAAAVQDPAAEVARRAHWEHDVDVAGGPGAERDVTLPAATPQPGRSSAPSDAPAALPVGSGR